MRTSLLSFAIGLLAFSTAIIAYPQDDANPAPSTSESASATAAPSSGAPEASASPTGTASPAETPAVNGTAAASSGTANGTAAATSSASAAATSSVYLESTPEDLRCTVNLKGRPKEDVSPFCEPEEGKNVTVGETYNVTWDPRLFTHNSTITVSLKYANDTNRNDIWHQDRLINEQGYVKLKIYDEYLNGYGNRTNVTLFITSEDADGKGDPRPRSGPVFTMITHSTNGTSNSDNGDDEIGKKAGIPVGLGVFLIAVAGLIFWFLRRRKRNAAGYMGKRSRSARMTGDESGVGASGFRDEPTRGLELQDRAGHGRQDSWEAGWDTSSSQGGGGGNAFRDEIDRQRRR
ncbi:MAG: hypothetical protein Q9208_006345 [Pyrenodesmia sp. 3 TL-2023]